jgi:DUF3037 family protein
MTACEYVLIEYVPLPHGETRLPIGLILLDEKGSLVRYATRQDWWVVRCIDARADVAVLQTLPKDLERIVKPAGEGGLRETLVEMSGRGFGAIEFSRPRGVETEDPDREFDRLFEEHVAPPRAVRAPSEAGAASRAGSRRWIHAQLSAALDQRGWGDRLQRNVPVDEFTAPGDTFRIDFCYRPNGVTNFLHALSLERDRNQAKVLSYTFGRIRARTAATLTAVVAEEVASSSPLAAQGSGQILLDAGIAIQPLATLDRLLDRMQPELGPAV